jgi:hypothetical protein
MTKEVELNEKGSAYQNKQLPYSRDSSQIGRKSFAGIQ